MPNLRCVCKRSSLANDDSKLGSFLICIFLITVLDSNGDNDDNLPGSMAVSHVSIPDPLFHLSPIPSPPSNRIETPELSRAHSPGGKYGKRKLLML